jgi:hypothetical protein
MEGIGELAGWTIRAAKPAGRELDNAFVHRRDDELRRRVVGKPTGKAEYREACETSDGGAILRHPDAAGTSDDETALVRRRHLRGPGGVLPHAGYGVPTDSFDDREPFQRGLAGACCRVDEVGAGESGRGI